MNVNKENIHADPFDGLGHEEAETIKRLLHYSWRDTDYDYSDLTREEKKRMSEDTFKKLRKWIGDDPRRPNPLTSG